MNWKQVDKAAFDAWLAAYPRKLESDIAGMFVPPLLTYSDFTLAPMWPESVVAKVILHENADSSNGYFVSDVLDVKCPKCQGSGLKVVEITNHGDRNELVHVKCDCQVRIT